MPSPAPLRRRLLLLLAPCALAAAAAAQVALYQDFDSGALDVAGSTIDLTDPSRPLVQLEPRRHPGAWGGDHWWVSFRIDGVAGRAPRFRLPTAGAFQGYSSQHRWVWTATPESPASWQPFDVGRVAGGFFESWNQASFVADRVFVASAIPYPAWRTRAHTLSLLGDPSVAPTPSADPGLVIGTTLGTAGGGYTDELGRSVPALELHGYVVTDPAAPGPKRKVVVIAGNHSGESTGSWVLQGFVDFARSADPEAEELRRVAEVLVYPQTDPEGRWAGYFRSNPENPAKNHNRHWDDPVGFSDVTRITAAMRADGGGDVDFFLDFHSFGSPTGLGYYLHTQNPLTSVLLAHVRALEPSLQDLGTVGSPTPGIAALWAAGAAGLQAEVGMTPETGFLAGQPFTRYLEIGEHWARAVVRAIRDAPEPLGPPSEARFLRLVRGLGPALHLRLNERGAAAGALAHDDSGHLRHGLYQGDAVLGARDPFTPTRGSAVKLEGTSKGPVGEHVVVPDFPVAGPAGELTLAFWFRTEDIDGDGLQYVYSHGEVALRHGLNVYFVERGHPTGQGDRLRTVFLDADDPEGFGHVLDVAPAPADGAWHHFALVVSAAGGASVYVDGLLHAHQPTLGGAAFDPATDLFLGVRSDLDPTRSYGGAGPDDGHVDELLLLDRALDADTVRALHESRLPVLDAAQPLR